MLFKGESREGATNMKKTLRRVLERLRAATTSGFRKPTSVRGGLQHPQRTQAVRPVPEPGGRG